MSSEQPKKPTVLDFLAEVVKCITGQDSVAIKDSTQLEPLGVRRVVEQPNKPDCSAVTQTSYSIAFNLQEAAARALEPIEERACYLAKRITKLRGDFYTQKRKERGMATGGARGSYYYSIEELREDGVQTKCEWYCGGADDHSYEWIPMEELWMDEQAWEDKWNEKIRVEYEEQQVKDNAKRLKDAQERLKRAEEDLKRLA
jgi:hypothetical protein